MRQRPVSDGAKDGPARSTTASRPRMRPKFSTRAANVAGRIRPLIEQQSPPADVARIAAIVASDFRFTYFGTAAFAVRLLRLNQKLADGIPMNPRRLANTLNTKPELLREFCGHFAKPGEEIVMLYADGTAVEVPVCWTTGGVLASSHFLFLNKP
jgi:hypothetical protein